MTFTPENITALIGGLVVLVGAISLAARQIIGALAEMKVAMKAEVSPLIDKVDETLAETKAVRHATNSAATKAETEADATRKEIAHLREQLGEAKQNAALLQQTQSQQVAVAASQAIKTVAQIVEAGVNELNGHPPAAVSLTNIDQNTKKIEKNTARTEATVEQLKKGTR